MQTRRDLMVNMLGMAAHPMAVVGAVSRSGLAAPNAETISLHRIEEFGGRADGSFDNTDAIHAAIARIKSDAGGVLQFSPGVYRFGNIDADVDHITIQGTRTTLVSSLPKSTDTAAIWLRGDNITVRDLTIDYDQPIVTDPPEDLLKRGKNGYGLRVGGRRDPKEHIAQEILIQDVTVKNARNGGITVYKARIARVINCTVLKTLGNGITFDGCQDTAIASCNFVEDTGDDLLIVATDSSMPGGTKSVIITENILRKGWAKGIASSGVDRLIVSGNIVEETYAGGISIIDDTFYKLGASNNVIVNGNYVFRSGHRYGAGMYHADKCTVGHSVLISAGSKNVSICNNTLDEGSLDGIRAFGSSFLSISGNSILNHRGNGIWVGDPGGENRSPFASFIVESNQIAVDKTGIVLGGGNTGRISANVITGHGAQKGDVAGIRYGMVKACLVSDNVINLQVPGTIAVSNTSKVESSTSREVNNHVVEASS